MTAGAARAVAEVTAGLRPLSLESVLATAALQTRVDRKYVLPADLVATLLARVPEELCVLEIDHLRMFRYESVYFDTPDLTAYRQHAHGRRRRVKVRTRAYLDTRECLLEFKSVGARGETVKERYPYPWSARHGLDPEARGLAHERVGRSIAAPALRETLTITYQRSTFVAPGSGSRMTCDVDLQFQDPDGRRSHPLGGLVVLESKTVGAESAVDRALRRLGVRPLSLSKYCVGMALLDPALPANRWNRELRTHFGWEPRRQLRPDGLVHPDWDPPSGVSPTASAESPFPGGTDSRAEGGSGVEPSPLSARTIPGSVPSTPGHDDASRSGRQQRT